MAGHFGTKHNRTPVCKICNKEPKYRAGLCRVHYFAAQRERRAEKRRMRASHCAHCGNLIESPSPWKQFCSRRCIQYARNVRERKLPVVARATCKHCKTEFSPTKAWQQFCSIGCKKKARNARLYTKGRKPETRIKGNCQSCGAPFDRPARFYSVRKKAPAPKFCSIQCAYKERRGEKSPKFRGGIITYRGCRWLQIAEEIRARDQYLCGICNDLPGRRKHHVDHVIPFRLMEQWGLDPNLYDNLQTLCNSCHSTKQGVEDRLLRGNVLGFLRGLVLMNYPIARIRAACAVAELSTKGLPTAAYQRGGPLGLQRG